MIILFTVLFIACIAAFLFGIYENYQDTAEKQLIKKCIHSYEEAIKSLPEENWLDFLKGMCLERGLCKFLMSRKIPIKKRLWITKIPYNYYYYNFWYKPPCSCNTREEAIECLQYRIDKMKTLL